MRATMWSNSQLFEDLSMFDARTSSTWRGVVVATLAGAVLGAGPARAGGLLLRYAGTM